MGFYHLFNTLLKNHSEEVFHVIAPFLTSIRYLLLQVSKMTIGSTGELSNRLPESCSVALARLFTLLSSHKQKLKHYAVYILADYLGLVRRQSLDARTRQNLLPGIYAVLDTCSVMEFKQLFATLAEEEKSLLRALHEDYTRDHKFKGKV